MKTTHQIIQGDCREARITEEVPNTLQEFIQ